MRKSPTYVSVPLMCPIIESYVLACDCCGAYKGKPHKTFCYWHKERTKKRRTRIRTLEGIMLAGPDDWIIQGIKGEVYPCKPDIFDATYEAVP